VPEKKTELSWDHSVVRGWLVMDRERKAAEPLLVAIEAGERSLRDLTRAEWRLLRGVSLIERLLDWSARRRYQDPAGMVHLAQLALFLASQISPRRYGPKLLADLRVRILTEMSNAYRVADNFEAAESSLDQATVWLVRGSKDARLTARLADVAASLCSDQGKFHSALELLTIAIGCYQRLGERKLAGRALISKGLIAGYNDKPEEGIVYLLLGLKYIAPDSDYELELSAVHALALNMVEIGWFPEARALLAQKQDLYRNSDFLNQLRLKWLQGKVSLGLEELKAAAEHFENVRQGFKLVHQSFDAALASLDLSLVYARQGRQKEVFALAEEMIATFRSLRISREAIASLAVLRKACEQPAASAELLAGHIRSCAAVVMEAQRGRAGKSQALAVR